MTKSTQKVNGNSNYLNSKQFKKDFDELLLEQERMNFSIQSNVSSIVCAHSPESKENSFYDYAYKKTFD